MQFEPSAGFLNCVPNKIKLFLNWMCGIVWASMASMGRGYYCKDHSTDEELIRLAKYLKHLAQLRPELNTGHQRWRENVTLGDSWNFEWHMGWRPGDREPF
jgi:hypothetical protein